MENKKPPLDPATFGNRIRLRHIQCFVAVAREQHLGKAAERLALSQPAVSKTLLELEQLLGVRLVERGRFGARLTPEGQAFLTHAVTMLDALDDARRAVGQDHVTQQEGVSVGALPTVAPDLLPTALSAFRSQCPDARVDIQVSANAPLLDRLQSGEVDFVLGRMADPQMMVGLSFELLYVEPLVIVARGGHPLFTQGTLSLRDVIAYPLIVSTRGTVPRHNAESHLQSRGVRLPSNCLETLSVSVARLVAMQSDSVWFTPAGAVRDDLDRGLLELVPVQLDGTDEPVGLLHRSEAGLSHTAHTFMQILREAALRRGPPVSRR